MILASELVDSPVIHENAIHAWKIQKTNYLTRCKRKKTLLFSSHLISSHPISRDLEFQSLGCVPRYQLSAIQLRAKAQVVLVSFSFSSPVISAVEPTSQYSIGWRALETVEISPGFQPTNLQITVEPYVGKVHG